MEPKDEIGLAVCAGMLSVWLVYGIAWILIKGRSVPEKEAFSHVFSFRRDMRILGLLMAVLSVALLLFFSVAISPDNLEPGDWLIALIVSGLMGGVGGITGVMLWRGRIYLGEKGVLGWSLFGLPVFAEWSKLNRLEFSVGMQSYKLIGEHKSVYVPALINDYGGFLDLVRRYAPGVGFEKGVDVCPEKLLEDRYLQNIEKHSLKLLLPSGAVVLASFYFLTPLVAVLFMSFVAGALLFSEALYMKLVKEPSSKIRKFLQFTGLFGFIVLMNISLKKYESHLGGESGIEGYMWLPLIIQTAVSAMFFGFFLLVIVNRVFGAKVSGSS